MAQMGLISRQIKSHKYRRCKKFHKVYGNILDRQFAPTAQNQVWTGDAWNALCNETNLIRSITQREWCDLSVIF